MIIDMLMRIGLKSFLMRLKISSTASFLKKYMRTGEVILKADILQD